MSKGLLLGKSGEDAAVLYLREKGYKIIERNFRTRNGEIDVIAIDVSEKEPVLSFIEVKTRTSNAFGTPLESITPWKLRALIRGAQFYKLTHKNLPDALRIDAVSLYMRGEKVEEIKLIKNITGA